MPDSLCRAGLKPATKKETPAQGFSCKSFVIFTNCFLENTSARLILWTFLKFLNGCSSRRVVQKIFSEESLNSLIKNPRFVYITLPSYNCVKESVMVNEKEQSWRAIILVKLK